MQTNTWTDYTNAGGSQGSSIGAYNTVQVAYYVSADAFYNNGQTSGSPAWHPLGRHQRPGLPLNTLLEP